MIGYQIDFMVPSHITLRPTTKNEHNLMEKVAKWVIDRGTSFESMIKIKQCNNPKFAFLAPAHALHPYYNFLKQWARTPHLFEIPKEKEVEVPQEEVAVDAATSIASHFLTFYSDDDDESEQSVQAADEIQEISGKDESLLSTKVSRSRSRSRSQSKQLRRRGKNSKRRKEMTKGRKARRHSRSRSRSWNRSRSRSSSSVDSFYRDKPRRRTKHRSKEKRRYKRSKSRSWSRSRSPRESRSRASKPSRKYSRGERKQSRSRSRRSRY